jgi:hypothetical protein
MTPDRNLSDLCEPNWEKIRVPHQNLMVFGEGSLSVFLGNHL